MAPEESDYRKVSGFPPLGRNAPGVADQITNLRPVSAGGTAGFVRRVAIPALAQNSVPRKRRELLAPPNELNAVALMSEAARMIEVSPAILPALLPAYRRTASLLRNLHCGHHALRGNKQVVLFKLLRTRLCSVNTSANSLESLSHVVNVLPATAVFHRDGPLFHNTDQRTRVVMPAAHLPGVHEELAECQRSRTVYDL